MALNCCEKAYLRFGQRLILLRGPHIFATLNVSIIPVLDLETFDSPEHPVYECRSMASAANACAEINMSMRTIGLP